MEDILKDILKEIQELKKTKIEKVTFTVQEAAEFTGFNHVKIRELISKHNTDFPFFKVGNKALIDKGMLVEWLEKISMEHRII